MLDVDRIPDILTVVMPDDCRVRALRGREFAVRLKFVDSPWRDPRVYFTVEGVDPLGFGRPVNGHMECDSEFADDAAAVVHTLRNDIPKAIEEAVLR